MKKKYLNFTPNFSKAIIGAIGAKGRNALQLLQALVSPDVADKSKTLDRLRPSYWLSEEDFEAVRAAAKSEYDAFLDKLEEMESYMTANPDLWKAGKSGRPPKAST